ncbi:hypothetical protein PoB_002399100 [Plakobranchus ocellatus]|uniref:Uncharacterized protein n=1 Tax=Plakobranchus ocellatus TaxID=259542 RepID=A0AAV3ZNH7_9GAST|nr:hypothetical protein PoB_002399100 [Plakobranchus ocellatus]
MKYCLTLLAALVAVAMSAVSILLTRSVPVNREEGISHGPSQYDTEKSSPGALSLKLYDCVSTTVGTFYRDLGQQLRALDPRGSKVFEIIKK